MAESKIQRTWIQLDLDLVGYGHPIVSVGCCWTKKNRIIQFQLDLPSSHARIAGSLPSPPASSRAPPACLRCHLPEVAHAAPLLPGATSPVHCPQPGPSSPPPRPTLLLRVPPIAEASPHPANTGGRPLRRAPSLASSLALRRTCYRTQRRLLRCQEALTAPPWWCRGGADREARLL